MSRRKKVLLSLAILAIIIFSFIGGQTYSKYVSQVSGQGTADIASWSFKVNGNDSQIQTINLAKAYNQETLLDNKIAPGTSGSFNINVDAEGSEVGVDYKVNFTNTQNIPKNLKFKYLGTELDLANEDEIQNKLSGRINVNDESKIRTIVIDWEWQYETGSSEQIPQNDQQDTNDAKNIPEFTFDVIVTGTQVKPQQS